MKKMIFISFFSALLSFACEEREIDGYIDFYANDKHYRFERYVEEDKIGTHSSVEGDSYNNIPANSTKIFTGFNETIGMSLWVPLKGGETGTVDNCYEFVIEIDGIQYGYPSEVKVTITEHGIIGERVKGTFEAKHLEPIGDYKYNPASLDSVDITDGTFDLRRYYDLR